MRAVTTLAVGLLIAISGCRTETPTDENQTRPPAQAFTFFAPRPMPRSEIPAGDRIKPGHWTSLSTSMRSNAGDVRGRLEVGAETRFGRRSDDFITDSDFDADAPATPLAELDVSEDSKRVSKQSPPSERGVVMPKGQRRRFDLRLLPPSTGGTLAREVVLRNRLVADSTTSMDIGGGLIRCLQPQQYFVVALSDRPERMGRLSNSDWIKPPSSSDQVSIARMNYAITVPPVGGVMALPESPLDWTSIAVVWWDRLSADQLTEAQLSSLLDWLHMGGRLVVSGPSAVDGIRGSPLEEYLPLINSGTSQLDESKVSDMLLHWSVGKDESVGQVLKIFRQRSDRLAVDGEIDDSPEKPFLRPASSTPGTSGLVISRRVGRGVVVQSRFDLLSDWLDLWRSNDSFVNSAVLGRPSRRYVARAGMTDDFEKQYDQTYPDLQSPRADASINTAVRIFGRDGMLSSVTAPLDSSVDELRLYRNSAGSMAAWNDQSDTVNVCVDLLRDQSGIEIPTSRVIVGWMCIYLLVLVPLNFIVFRFLGRLEWAWFSIPVIAVTGALWMAKSAQLDIGFSRSIHQVSLLEMPANGERGHLSSVAAIYNSLSSVYCASFDHQSSAASALPINDRATGSTNNSIELADNFGATRFGDTDGQIRWRESDDGTVGLTGIPIASNQVRMLHGEEMVDVGRWQWSGDRLVNRTSITWRDAWIVRRGADGKFESASLGTIDPETSVSVLFANSPADIRSEMPLGVERLMISLANPAAIAAGACRLIARTGENSAKVQKETDTGAEEVTSDQNSDASKPSLSKQNDATLGSMRIEPAATQQRSCTVLLAHLEHPPLREEEKDASLLPAKQAP